MLRTTIKNKNPNKANMAIDNEVGYFVAACVAEIM
jgi:hypothetical protein